MKCHDGRTYKVIGTDEIVTRVEARATALWIQSRVKETYGPFAERIRELLKKKV